MMIPACILHEPITLSPLFSNHICIFLRFTVLLTKVIAFGRKRVKVYVLMTDRQGG